MNYDEFKRLAKGMKSIWTHPTFLPDKDALDIWYKLLKDLPYEQASMAIARYASTHSFEPKPADIRKQIVTINDDSEDWGKAWQTVVRYIGKYGMYGEETAIDNMDELTGMVIKRLGWKMICRSEQSELMAIRANFRMLYEQMQEEQREAAQISPGLKNAIERITGKEVKRIGV